MKKALYLLLLTLYTPINLSAQWAIQKTNAGDNYNTLWIDAVDANTVWASLEQNVNGGIFNPVNKVVRTVDGGKNWTVHNVGNDPLDFITSIFARSASECWVVTFNFGTFTGKIFATHNDGQSFEQKGLNAYTEPGSYPDVIHFFDAQNGIIFGDPADGEYGVYTTDDGGENWSRVPAEALPDPLPGEFGLQEWYGFNAGAIMFSTNANRLFRTEDHGLSWMAIDLPSQPANTANVGGSAFADAQNGLLVYNYNVEQQTGGQPKPLRTTDGGLTWSVIEDSNGDQFDEYSNLVHVPGTAGTFLSGNFDGYAFTKDFGVTWHYFENGKFRVPNVDCIDGNTCFGSIWSDTKNTGSKIGRWVGYHLANPNPPGNALRMKPTPNPATDVVTVTFTPALPVGGLLYILDNTNTYMLTQQALTAGQTSATFNVGSLTPGMYWLKAVVGNKVLTEKFFKN